MAGKFMKIKRVVLPIMSLIILTSQLAGCATLNSQEFLETVNNVDEVVIEYSELDNSSTPLASDSIEVNGQQFTISPEEDEDNAAIGVVDTQQTEDQQQELTELSEEALHTYFQKAYDMGVTLDEDLETRISGELDILVSLVDADAIGKLPSDYADQYRTWRPAEQAPAAEVQLFTEVNETVYATGTVNLRSGPGTNNAKVGSMTRGQSATRTGIGISDAEGWSRVVLADGSTVYVSNSYLSTTKPAAQQQQTQQNQQQSHQAKPQGGSQQQGSSVNQGTPGYNPYENLDLTEISKDTRTEEQKRQDEEMNREASEGTIGEITAGGLG